MALDQPPYDVLLQLDHRHEHLAPLGVARDELLALPVRTRRVGAHRHCLMSTKRPSIAAAAAICGETRWVRPPRPWRPSKLRLEVEAQRSPGCRMSGFIPRHMLQPGSRHSNPADLNTWSRPSCSACRFTFCDPGTTIARTDVET